jgi:hypothetical protein
MKKPAEARAELEAFEAEEKNIKPYNLEGLSRPGGELSDARAERDLVEAELR